MSSVFEANRRRRELEVPDPVQAAKFIEMKRQKDHPDWSFIGNYVIILLPLEEDLVLTLPTSACFTGFRFHLKRGYDHIYGRTVKIVAASGVQIDDTHERIFGHPGDMNELFMASTEQWYSLSRRTFSNAAVSLTENTNQVIKANTAPVVCENFNAIMSATTRTHCTGLGQSLHLDPGT